MTHYAPYYGLPHYNSITICCFLRFSDSVSLPLGSHSVMAIFVSYSVGDLSFVLEWVTL